MSVSHSVPPDWWRCIPGQAFAQKPTAKPLLVAAVVTEYRILSHADVILTKILEGWHHDGKVKPALKLVSLYVDQFNQHDIARE